MIPLSPPFNGPRGDLPLFQYLLTSLHRLPNIRLVHVKAHGDVKKQLQWTRPQWGNYYADLIAKNQESAFSYDHLEMDLLPIEQLFGPAVRGTGHTAMVT